MITDLIHVMGESHVCSFTGLNIYHLNQVKGSTLEINNYDTLPQFRTYVFDAIRAYHFTPTSNYSITKLFFSFLRTNIPPPATLLLSIGEVDCRGPILNKLHETERTIEELVEECVSNYLIGLKYLSSLGYDLILYGPLPNCRVERNVHDLCPTYLTVPEWCDLKEQAVRLFTKKLKDSRFPVVSILDWILENKIDYDREWWQDILHISFDAWPQIKLEFEKIGVLVQ